MYQTPWKWDGTAPIGRLLAQARARLGLSQSEVARRLGVSGANLSRIEHGADLRVSTLVDIARELQLEPMLVPKRLVPTVRALLDESTDATGKEPAPERGRFT